MNNVKVHITDIDLGINLEFPNGEDFIKQFGFGFFITDWKEGEITITPEAKRIILEHGKELDLGSIEFFDYKRLGFCELPISQDSISTNGNSKDWIRNLPEAQP